MPKMHMNGTEQWTSSTPIVPVPRQNMLSNSGQMSHFVTLTKEVALDVNPFVQTGKISLYCSYMAVREINGKLIEFLVKTRLGQPRMQMTK